MARTSTRGLGHGLLSTAAVALALALLAPAGAAEPRTVSVTIPVGAYRLSDTGQGQEVAVDGFGSLLVPGKPKLPARIFAIAIPPGAEVVGVRYETGTEITLPGTYQVPPAPLPRVIGQEDPAIFAQRKAVYDENYASVYGSDEVYPPEIAEFVRPAGYRKYKLADVRVAPLAYRPASGELTYYPEITVFVDYEFAAVRAPAMIDNLERTEQVAREIILNYEEAQAWYPPGELKGRGLHDFVIITLDSLTDEVQPLVDWETSKGRTVEVVTTSWIAANYSGYDLAAEMRMFLREKYPSGEWGIQDVLLVGHYDDVPMRRCAQDLGYGQPETDFYYAELTDADNESWDSNENHQYGEDADNVDFYSEVNVGRIPWSSASTVASICNKSVAYEQNDDPSFKKNMLLLGAFFWDDDPNPRTDNAVLMETKVDQTWMADWTMTRMYEEGYSTYPMDYNLTHSNVVSVWSAGTYAFVNWAGHGSEVSAHVYHGGMPAFITSSDCPSLSDDYPAIIFADSCSNSDTNYLNIGQAMMQHGAVAFEGATKVALGCPGWSDPAHGSSQSLDYYFTTGVTEGKTVGQAHQAALLEMYERGLWGYQKYEAFEWGALWGNPDLAMVPPPPLRISFPNGLPELLEPGVATSFDVQIANGAETYVPGTGTLHYRYDGGTFLTAPLTHVSDNRYEATLPPALCADTPEFYISAQGDGGSTVYSPSNAPAGFYTATVGTLTMYMEDDFETDQGWSVYAGADTGNWERADPQQVSSSGTITQPEDDHTVDGTLCYVTGPLAGSGPGSYDVDGGPTRLTSPVLDLAEMDAVVSYWRWYHISTQWDDELVVEVSNNNGSSWVTVETVDHRQTWTYVEWQVSDYVTPSAQVRVRFTADDSPNNSLVEALIDDFKVYEFSCEDPGYTLTVNVDGDGWVEKDPDQSTYTPGQIVELTAHAGSGWTFDHWSGDLDGSDNPEQITMDGNKTVTAHFIVEGPPPDCPEDLYTDGVIDLQDLGVLLAAYGSTPADPNWNPYADFDDSNLIDLSDLGVLLAVYGQDCPTR